MSDSNSNQGLYFVTLKISGGINSYRPAIELFDNREYCDQLIKTLIYCIENRGLVLYGFVLLTNQIHLIISTKKGLLKKEIEVFKKLSANEIFIIIRKNLSLDNHHKTEKGKEIKKFFDQYLKKDYSGLWKKEDHWVELQLKNEQKILTPISGDILLAHLADNNRNYMQLGADAFTRLMLETMKI